MENMIKTIKINQLFGVKKMESAKKMCYLVKMGWKSTVLQLDNTTFLSKNTFKKSQIELESITFYWKQKYLMQNRLELGWQKWESLIKGFTR